MAISSAPVAFNRAQNRIFITAGEMLLSFYFGCCDKRGSKPDYPSIVSPALFGIILIL